MDRNPAFAAIVLAAGKAERFGGGKMAAELAGRPLLAYALDAALASPADRVIVVARPGNSVPQAERTDLVQLESGALSDSLRAGMAAVGKAQGVFVFLGDMPLVPHDVAWQLYAAIAGAPAALPVFRGKPGHPVLLTHQAFSLVETLSGDEGLGKPLRNLDGVVRLPVREEGTVLDIDAVDDLRLIARRIRP